MSDRWRVDQGDCIEWLDSLPADSADLVFGSPPYCDARTYGIDAVYDCQQWVEWMLRVTDAAVRVCKGLVIWVAAGVQRDSCYWPACEGLMWEWWKRGSQLWRPCVWWKVDNEEGGTGIPGSGGKQWLRNDWEYVMAFKKEGILPWADNTAMGHLPVCSRVGGEMSNRTADGRRSNGHTKRKQNGKMQRQSYTENPRIVNPGNCIRINDGLIVKARVGGGHIGSNLAHKNEAPFPEKLADFFIRSFCPPGGLVLDPFSGSGTTGARAKRWARRFHGCDIRQSQVDLSRLRIAEETPDMFEMPPPVSPP